MPEEVEAGLVCVLHLGYRHTSLSIFFFFDFLHTFSSLSMQEFIQPQSNTRSKIDERAM